MVSAPSLTFLVLKSPGRLNLKGSVKRPLILAVFPVCLPLQCQFDLEEENHLSECSNTKERNGVTHV